MYVYTGVFIARFKICFENSIFGYSKILMRSLYSVLALLISFSFFIFAEIIRNDGDIFVIIISEIIWELLIEAMSLWLLYLFMNKLYKLLKMSLSTTSNRNKDTVVLRRHKSNVSIFNDVMESMTPKIQESRSRSKSKSGSKKKSKSKSGNDKIHGNKSPETTENIEPVSTVHSAYNMDTIDITERNEKPKIQSTVDEEPISFTVNPTTKFTENQLASFQNENSRKRKSSYEEQIVDLVNVMNKMCLLVLVAVISSILSVIGNIFIEIHQLNRKEQHATTVIDIWIFVLPVIDMIITSFMLYLQFNFSQNVYAKMCYKPDVLFLRCCLNMHGYLLKKMDSEHQQSVAIDTATSTISAKSEDSKNTVATIKDKEIEVVVMPALTPQITPANSIIHP